jgi:hypothetical protein
VQALSRKREKKPLPPKWVFRTNVTSDSGIVTSHSGAT